MIIRIPYLLTHLAAALFRRLSDRLLRNSRLVFRPDRPRLLRHRRRRPHHHRPRAADPARDQRAQARPGDRQAVPGGDGQRGVRVRDPDPRGRDHLRVDVHAQRALDLADPGGRAVRDRLHPDLHVLHELPVSFPCLLHHFMAPVCSRAPPPPRRLLLATILY